MSNEAAVGDIVLATAGRDKDRLFYVLSKSEGYVYLADGKHRRVELPKCKKSKHALRVWSGGQTGEAIRSGTAILNRQLRKALAVYRAGTAESESEEVY